MPLALVPNLALLAWPPDGATCISYKFSNQVGSLAMPHWPGLPYWPEMIFVTSITSSALCACVKKNWKMCLCKNIARVTTDPGY